MTTRVFILHGYGATPRDHWFPWLQGELAAHGVEASVLAMPDSANPQPDVWDRVLRDAIALPDEQTFFVAHSLGCVALLRFLSAPEADVRLGGLVLVSGFAERVPGFSQLDAFTDWAFDPARIIRLTPQRSVIASRDDPIVPYALTAKLSVELKAPLHTVEHGGHFLASEGFDKLPLVYTELMKMLTPRLSAAR